MPNWLLEAFYPVTGLPTSYGFISSHVLIVTVAATGVGKIYISIDLLYPAAACFLIWFLQGSASFWLWLHWLSCLSHWSKSVWSGRLEASTHVLQFSLLGRFSYVARWAEISEFSESLSLFHEVLVTKLWETRNWDGTKCLELQNPLIFFASLIMGSALLPMATNRKEFALLGGTFLFGLGALEMVLRMGGYWGATFVEKIDQKE